MTRYVKGHQWSRDILIVSMTIWMCHNHIESIVDNIYDKLEQNLYQQQFVWENIRRIRNILEIFS